MSEKIRRVIIFFIVYGLIFWIGFKTGVIQNRMKNKVIIEKMLIKQEEVAENPAYYIVEKYNYGTYSQVAFRLETENDLTIKIFLNEKLKPLLKLRDIQIYTTEGEQVY